MKLLFKIIGIFLLLLLIGIVASPFFLEKNIDKIVRKTLAEQVNAEVDFSKINLSLIKKFPNATISIKDLTIINRAPFEKDTLLNAKKIMGAISFSQLFKGFKNGVAIDKILINEADINILVNENGKANYDISKPSTTESVAEKESTESNFKLNLDYEILNSNINYHDQSSKTKIALHDLSHSGKGNVSSSVTDLITKTSLDLGYELNNVTYAKKMPVFLDATFEIDQENNKYTLKNNNALINHIPLAFSGFIQLVNEKNTDIELDFITKDASFKNLLSALPNAYKKDINGVYVKGNFDLHGSIKGIVNEIKIPIIDISLATLNSSFKYPDLPKGIDDITIKATVTNKTGNPDATRIDIDAFKMKIDQDNFSATGHLTNLSKNLTTDINTKGTVNLANLNQAYPVKLDTKLEGIINADLDAKFSLNDIENENYERIQRTGNVTLKDFVFSSEELPHPININNAEINFAENKVNLKSFLMKSGTSDISATGRLDNIIPFVLSDKVLKGNFNLNSNTFKVNDFLSSSEEEASSQETSNEEGNVSSTDGLIPSFLDITSTFYAKEVIYDNLNLKNTVGKLSIKDQKAILKDVTTNIFGGTIAFDGGINAKEKTPLFDMNLNMQKLSIAQSFNGFEILKKMAPIASALEGLFSTNLSLNGNLTSDLTPNLTSLKGKALSNLINAKMNPEKNNLISSLNQKTDFINLNKINLKDITTKLNFEDGKIKVSPFDFKLKDDISVTASGGHAFDGGLNYNLNMNIPAKYLGDSGGILSSLSAQEQASTKVALPISLGGTLTAPKIGLNMKSAISGLSKQIIANQKQKAKQKLTNEVSKQLNKNISGKAGDVLGKLLGNQKKSNTATDASKANSEKKSNDVVKEKAGKLIEGLFKRK